MGDTTIRMYWQGRKSETEDCITHIYVSHHRLCTPVMLPMPPIMPSLGCIAYTTAWVTNKQR